MSLVTALDEEQRIAQRRASRDDSLLTAGAKKSAERLQSDRERAIAQTAKAESARAEVVARIHAFRDLLGHAARSAHIINRCQAQLDWALSAHVPNLDEIVSFEPEKLRFIGLEHALVDLFRSGLPPLLESRRRQLAEAKGKLIEMARQYTIDPVTLLRELRAQGNELAGTAEQIAEEVALATN